MILICCTFLLPLVVDMHTRVRRWIAVVDQCKSKISVDSITSAAAFRLRRWDKPLSRTAAGELLRTFICRFHGQNPTNIFRSRIRASQAALADHAGISREWCCTLLGRMRTSGWLEFRAVRQDDGRFAPIVFRAGKKLKRLIMILLGARRKKSNRVNSRSHLVPFSKRERKISYSKFQKLKQMMACAVRSGP